METTKNTNFFFKAWSQISVLFKTSHDDLFLEKKDDIVYAKSFLIPLTMMGMFFSIISIFANLGLHLVGTLQIVPFISLFLYFIIYLFVRKGIQIDLFKWIFVSVTIFMINLTWFFNYGSYGPWVYLFVLLFSYLIFVSKGRQFIIIVSILLVNIAAQFILEYFQFLNFNLYPNASDRIIDTYSSIVLYGVFSYIFMTTVKRRYENAYQEARRSDELKSSFLTNMSHEIRTPLNAIVGFSNLLAEGKLSAEDRESFREIINDGNQSLLRLVGDILDVSLIESGQINLVNEVCDINSMMEKFEMMFYSVLKEKDLDKFKLVIDIPNERVNINADCGRLQQIIVNLLDNAIKFTEEGEVTYGFTVRNNSISFFVKDTGIGIEDKHLDHLFDRFYKVEDDNKKLYRGTGIGLFLVKRLVEYLGGHIEVQSVYGQGTQFYFDIPANEMKIIVPEKLAVVPSIVKKALKDSVFLVIEDDNVSSMFLDRMLSNKEVTVYRASDGEKGLKIFKEHQEINLVLLDIKLPGMDGFAILKELRKINNKVPVIAQTAMAMIGDRKKCMDAGFDEYITKPLNANLLMKKIQMFVLPNPNDDNS